ncbi:MULTISPECIES: hypothetical protein [unclassified Afipia]|uniref:hypothetical protein n=1 Tax=unclassified Afipia TaxID=2642050 RepID=UPI0004654B3A|nr:MULTISPECIES: hypothetical protein [unclassified Afipia]
MKFVGGNQIPVQMQCAIIVPDHDENKATARVPVRRKHSCGWRMIAAARTEIARCAAITGARVSMPQTQKRRLQKETAFCGSNIV